MKDIFAPEIERVGHYERLETTLAWSSSACAFWMMSAIVFQSPPASSAPIIGEPIRWSETIYQKHTIARRNAERMEQNAVCPVDGVTRGTKTSANCHEEDAGACKLFEWFKDQLASSVEFRRTGWPARLLRWRDQGRCFCKRSEI